jgi:hypothetical protein
MTRLYAYCLCDGAEAAGLDLESLTGVGGSLVRLFDTGDFAVVVGDFAGRAVLVNREDLMAHNRVNALVLARTTPLPFRFGTLVTTEQLGEYARRNEAILRAALARVKGCVEMSVKLIRPALRSEESSPASGKSQPASEESRAAVKRGHSEAVAHGPAATPDAGRGTAYMAAKRRAVLGDEKLKAGAEEIAVRLAACVSDVVRASSVRLSPAEALAVRAAHLVERERIAEYQSRLREFGASRPDLRLLMSGPWPPYSFAA